MQTNDTIHKVEMEYAIKKKPTNLQRLRTAFLFGSFI